MVSGGSFRVRLLVEAVQLNPFVVIPTLPGFDIDSYGRFVSDGLLGTA